MSTSKKGSKKYPKGTSAKAGKAAASVVETPDESSDDDTEDIVVDVIEVLGVDDGDEDEEVVPAEEDAGEESDDEDVAMMPTTKHNSVIRIIRPENRMTSHWMTKYEITELISQRSTQIAQYANCLVDITGLSDPIDQARRELMQQKCPLTLVREVGQKMNKETGVIDIFAEEWDPNHMTLPISWTT